LGGFGALFEGAKPTKAPHGDGTAQEFITAAKGSKTHSSLRQSNNCKLFTTAK